MLVRNYTEGGFTPIPPIRLSDEEYARATQCLAFGCADVIPIDRGRKRMWLARRRAKPMAGWWWLGGRMAAHEEALDAALRNMVRETGLTLEGHRLTQAAVLDIRWKDRMQEPQTIGCNMLTRVFTVELTADELAFAGANLEQQEYREGTGLVAFDREKLVAENVFPAILDLYDHLFGQSMDVACGRVVLAASDARRDISEFAFAGGSFQDFTVKNPDKPLGQHFHREKFEVFYFLEGGGTVQTARVTAAGAVAGPIATYPVGPGTVVRVPPFVTHRFNLEPQTRFIAFSSKPFDPNDLIACPIG